jgi:hypothetical protein
VGDGDGRAAMLVEVHPTTNTVSAAAAIRMT